MIIIAETYTPRFQVKIIFQKSGPPQMVFNFSTISELTSIICHTQLISYQPMYPLDIPPPRRMTNAITHAHSRFFFLI